MNKSVKFNFFPYQWGFEDEIDDTNTPTSIIRAYGWNEKNESIYLSIPDFRIPIWLELPEHIEWTETRTRILCNFLSTMQKTKGFNPTSINFVNKQKLYYANIYKNKDGKYQNKKFPFLEVTFKSNKALSSFVFTLKRGINVPMLENKLMLKVHASEPSITPVLKLFAHSNLPSSNWIKCKGLVIPEDERESTRKHEYTVSYKNMEAMKDDEASTLPIVYPKILSFDNEAYSSLDGSMPKAEKPSDKVFMIGATFIERVGNEKKITKYLLYLNELNKYPLKHLQDITVKNFRCEADLYCGFTQLIKDLDPDVIIGYNIFGWDIKYMYDRSLNMLNCIGEFDMLSCISGKHAPLKDISWSSSAYGKQAMNFMDVEGRLMLDLLPFIKRNYKLSNYRLETVCDEFLKTNKDPIKPKDIFRSWKEKDLSLLTDVGKYCIQDTYVVYLLYEKLLIWFDLVESATTNCVPIFYLYTKGQQIKMYSSVLKYAIHNDIVVQSNAFKSAEGDKYTGAYVSKPKPGIYRNILPFDFASLYPSIIMGYNIDYSTIVNDDSIPDELCNVFEWEEHINCLRNNSKINLFGLSTNIDKLANNNSFLKVISYDNEKNGLIYSKQTNFFNQGIKNCIRLTFQDGSYLDCTPDHKLLDSDNNWIQAKDCLNQKIKAGVIYPECDLDLELQECYNFLLEPINLKITNKQELIKAQAFMRIMGYLLTDGSVGEKVCLFMGHNFDVDTILDDIELVCNFRPKPSRNNSCFQIVLPAYLKHIVKNMNNIVFGKKTNQDSYWPDFLMKDNIPKCLLREFLGGLYGGDGICPCFGKKAKNFSSLSFGQTRENKYRESFVKYIIQIQEWLKLFDIQSNLTYYENYQGKDYLSIRINIEHKYLTTFTEKIGFRHCCHKNVRLTIAYRYHKLKERISKQRTNILNETKLLNNSYNNIQKSYFDSLKKVFQNEPVLNEKYSKANYDWIHSKIKDGDSLTERVNFYEPYFHSVERYLKETDSYNMFSKDNGKVCYAVDFKEDSIPCSNLKVIDIRAIGEYPVFDIEIENTHNFLANGIVAHNCIHDKVYMEKVKKKQEAQEKKKSKGLDIKDEIDFENDPRTGTKEDEKRLCAEYKFRFLKSNVVGKGVIPTLLENLIKARKDTRKIIAKNEDIIDKLKSILSSRDTVRNSVEQYKINKNEIQRLEEMNLVLDKRQLAYKVSANSMYGAMGVKEGYLPLLPAAMCVTSRGRESIKKASAFLEKECGGTVIYNDTDSAYTYFRCLEGKTMQEVWKYAEEVVEKVKELFPPPMKLEFEGKCYTKFLILTKKRYVATMSDENGNISKKLLKRGIVLTRRDNCKFLRDLYEKCIYYILDNADSLGELSVEMTQKEIMQNKSVQGMLNLILDMSNSLFQRTYSFKDFVITKGLTKLDYGNKASPAHFAVAKKMIQRGIEILVGTRIEYLLLDLGNGYDKKEKQQDQAEDVNYFGEYRELLRINYIEYFKRQSVLPIEELLNVVLKLEDFMKSQLELRIQKSLYIQQIKKVNSVKIEFVD